MKFLEIVKNSPQKCDFIFFGEMCGCVFKLILSFTQLKLIGSTKGPVDQLRNNLIAQPSYYCCTFCKLAYSCIAKLRLKITGVKLTFIVNCNRQMRTIFIVTSSKRKA